MPGQGGCPFDVVLGARTGLAELELLDREIVMLREFEQLSYAEISDLLQLPINTVRSRLFRARAALRELLDPSTAAASSQVQKATGADGSQNAVSPDLQKGFRL